MDNKEAEKLLKDHLLNGVAAEIFWAKEARALAEMIGKHSTRVNNTRYVRLFGRLQEIFSERETMSVAKIFDRYNRRYPVRGIPNIIAFLIDNIDKWDLQEKSVFIDFLASNGIATKESISEKELLEGALQIFSDTLPSPENKGASLSDSLCRVLESRDKVHAHNEAIDRNDRNRPRWSDTKALIDYAENFLLIISRGVLGTAAIVTTPNASALYLEEIMALSNLVEENFYSNNGNKWKVERLKKQLRLASPTENDDKFF